MNPNPIDISVSDLWKILMALGVAAGAVFWAWNKAYSLNKSIDDKQDKAEADAIRRDLERKVEQLKSEVSGSIALITSRAEGQYAQQDKALALLEQQIRSMCDTINRVEQMLERLLAKE